MVVDFLLLSFKLSLLYKKLRKCFPQSPVLDNSFLSKAFARLTPRNWCSTRLLRRDPLTKSYFALLLTLTDFNILPMSSPSCSGSAKNVGGDHVTDIGSRTMKVIDARNHHGWKRSWPRAKRAPRPVTRLHARDHAFTVSHSSHTPSPRGSPRASPLIASRVSPIFTTSMRFCERLLLVRY